MNSQQYDAKISKLIEIAKQQSYKLSFFEIGRVFGDDYDEQKVLDDLDYEGIRIVDEDDLDFVSQSGENTENISINNPFNPDEVQITPKTLSMSNIIDRIKNKELVFDIKYQRKADLWDDIKQSLLIESLILRIPLPAFYFDSFDDDKWQIIDGLQRMSAIKKYVVERNFELCGLEFLKSLNGKKYDDLPRAFQRRINETNFVAYLLMPSTPKNVKFHIFKRLNTGGLPLTLQEIRNALYQGKATEFLEKMSKNAEFRRVCNINSDRMLDKEYCLRYVAAVHEKYRGHKKDMDIFLNQTMESISKYDSKEFDNIMKCFSEDLIRVDRLFGSYSFRKITFSGENNRIRRGPINKALFEVWCVIIHSLKNDNIDILESKKEKFIKKVISKYDEAKFQMNLRSSDMRAIADRENTLKKTINDILEGKND